MAHVQKFTRGSANRIIGHCEREKSDNGDYLKYKTSSDIDNTKTHQNIHMRFKDGLTAHERLAKRLEEVYVFNRKDVNVMCDWVLTYPETLPLDNKKIKYFFSSSVKFLQQRYGKQNLISANIHMDEAQPHLHYCFVPVVYDTKKQRNKVSAKEVLNRRDLETFHNDLGSYLQKEIGLNPELIHSGITKNQGGNKSISQLKTASAKLEQIESEIIEAKYRLQNIKLEQQEEIERTKKVIHQYHTLVTDKIPEAQAEMQKIKSKYAEVKESTNALQQDYKNKKQTLERIAFDIKNIPAFIEEYKQKLGYHTRKILESYVPSPSNSTNKVTNNKKHARR